MKSAALFCAAIWIIVLGSNAAPYVHHHQDNPDPTTQTETGPQMREMNSLLSLFNDLFNFMDILMDPQSYTNHHEVQTLIKNRRKCILVDLIVFNIFLSASSSCSRFYIFVFSCCCLAFFSFWNNFKLFGTILFLLEQFYSFWNNFILFWNNFIIFGTILFLLKQFYSLSRLSRLSSLSSLSTFHFF